MPISTCPRCRNSGVEPPHASDRYCSLDCPAARGLRARVESDPRFIKLRAEIDRLLGEQGPVLVTLPGGRRVLHQADDDVN